MKKKRVVILGSTGSIGVNSLDVVRRLKKRFQVVGLAANQNVDLVRRQIREFKPLAVAVDHSPSAAKLSASLKKVKNSPPVWNHQGGLERLASFKKADFVLSAIVGGRGLVPLVEALKSGKTVGLANKEALIMAGDLIMGLSKKKKAALIPVDSEHSAIFQCLKGHAQSPVKKIILTASGGPFYRHKGDLSKISVVQALNHPTWKMGKKITIDSATLMNKGLEAIEAHHLFQVPMEKIEIVIHPQSIVHSLVEFEDGAMLAHLSQPDMRLPIQYALTYPERVKTPIKPLDLTEVSRLDFAKPDFSRFPCLRMALDAGQKGGTAPTALSAGNEVAVQAFLSRQILFTDIARVVKHVVMNHSFKAKPTLKDVLAVDAWARRAGAKFIQKMKRKSV